MEEISYLVILRNFVSHPLGFVKILGIIHKSINLTPLTLSLAPRDVEKQKRARRKVKMDNQCAYTDSNRAMAVCIGDKELSKALKNFEKDISVEEMNSGVVNSEMYKRQALHYSARKQHEAARKYLESGFGDYC